MVEVDVGGNYITGFPNPQFPSSLLDNRGEHGRARLDYGAVAVFYEVNSENSVNTGDFAFQAVGLLGDSFKLNGYFFTSQNQD